jgi:hypothetical protein
MGRREDIRLDALIELSKDAARFFGRDMAGTIWRTGPIPSAFTAGA